MLCHSGETRTEQKLFDNSFGGQTYETTYTIYAQNAILVNEQNALVSNMDIYLPKSGSQSMGSAMC